MAHLAAATIAALTGPLTRAHVPLDAPAATLTPGPNALLHWDLEAINGTGKTACLRGIALGGPFNVIRYVVGEGGIVLRGEGGTFQTIRDDDFPNYYYGVGVARLGRGDILVVSGFVDGSKPPKPPLSLGVVMTSTDGGKKWADHVTVSNDTWLGGPAGLLYDGKGGGHIVVPSATATSVFSAPLEASGKTGPWVATPAGTGWHAGPMVLYPGGGGKLGKVVLTGIQLCLSSDAAATFLCRPAADEVFDGGVAEQKTNASNWLTGGGSIAPDLAGWVHRSSDGGQTWGNRTLQAPYPIRWVGFGCGAEDAKLALAAGGNYFSGVGGIWSSADLGATWKLEVDTGAEMSSCAVGLGFVTCVGASAHKQSVVATAKC